MFLGNGTKNQFKTLTEMGIKLKKVLKQIPKNSVLLYFGDSPNKKKPDVGYLFEKTHQLRPDIKIYMIQISYAKNWGMPSFVTDVYWHNDFPKKQMWGGINKNNKPVYTGGHLPARTGPKKNDPAVKTKNHSCPNLGVKPRLPKPRNPGTRRPNKYTGPAGFLAAARLGSA